MLYEFDESYQKGKPQDWQKNLDTIRENIFPNLNLDPKKPYFAQNVAVKKADAAESSDDEASKPPSKEEKDKATLPKDFLDEKE